MDYELFMVNIENYGESIFYKAPNNNTMIYIVMPSNSMDHKKSTKFIVVSIVCLKLDHRSTGLPLPSNPLDEMTAPQKV